MQENISSILPEIENKIFTVRGLSVMLDSDLALLYGVETKRINEAVKRNINRFPEWFMFQLTYTEWENLRFQIGTSSNEGENASRSQIATLNEMKHVEQDNLRSQIVTSSENDNQQENALRFQIGTLESKSNSSLRSQNVTLEERNIEQEKDSRSQIVTLNEKKDCKEDFLRSQFATLTEKKDIEAENLRSQFATSSSDHGGRRHLPFAFTEQGVAMLSAVLKSETAVKVSIQIMAAFVALRKLHYQSAGLYQRLELVEKKQIEADNHFNKIFSALEKRDTIPAQGIFFNGQIFDAYKFVADIIKSAATSIILIDNYIDETTLALLSKRNTGIKAIIYSEHLSRNQIIDLQKLNAQYETIEIRKLKHNHDRFLIIDEKEMYHFGASLKDLGKKIFGFSKMDNEVGLMLGRVQPPRSPKGGNP
jgi:ORF6N domain